ncbi:conserved hypothetical protein [Burkholderia vietnamiensis]|nr:conserved hypothetical protein [Burkholderia vietnamiensis]
MRGRSSRTTRRSRRRCPTGRRCASSAATAAGARRSAPVRRCNARRPPRCAAARTNATFTSMRTRAHGAARCRRPTRRASGARSDARAGRSEMTARAAYDCPAWVGALLSQRWVLPVARAALVSAYLIAGIYKLLDFNAAAAEQAHFGLHPGPVWAAMAIVVEIGGPLCVLSRRFTWLGAGGLGVDARRDAGGRRLLEHVGRRALHGAQRVLRASRADRRAGARRRARQYAPPGRRRRVRSMKMRPPRRACAATPILERASVR